MAAVEDAMWFYRALHAHIERELMATVDVAARLSVRPGSDAGDLPHAEACGYVPAEARGDILDAGCGTGGLIRRLAPKHPDWTWTGIDLEPLACALARERTRAEIVEGSVTALPFESQRFDAVVCADVLYHLDDDEAALREIFRVLKPNGVAVINVPAHRWLWSYHDVTVHGRRRYVRAELREKLQRAGFGDLRLTHWNALPLPLVFLRRKLLPRPPSGSDVRLYPAPVEMVLRGVIAVERAWLAIGGLPFGSSILATARKPL